MSSPSIKITTDTSGASASIRRYTTDLKTLRKELQAVGGDLDKLSKRDQHTWDALNHSIHEALRSPAARATKRRLDQMGIGESHVADILADRRLTPAQRNNLVRMYGGPGVDASGEPRPGAGTFSGFARGAGQLFGASRVGGAAAEGFAAGGAGGALAGGGLALGAMIAYQGFSDAREGESSNERFEVALDRFARQINASTQTYAQLDTAVRKSADGLELTHSQALQLTRVVSMAGNVRDFSEASQRMRGAVGLARGFGGDVSATASAVSGMTYLGRGSQSDRQIALMIGDTISRSGLQPKFDEVVSSLSAAVTQVAARTGSAQDMGTMMSMVSSMSMDKSNPGFAGASAAQIFSKADATFAAGGGAGEAGQVFNLDALNAANKDFGGNPFLLHYLNQGGLSASAKSMGIGTSTTSNLESVMNKLGVRQGGKLSKDQIIRGGFADELSNDFGLSDPQGEAFIEAYQRRGSAGLGATEQLLQRNGINPNQVNASGIEALSNLAAGNVDDVRKSLANRTDLSEDEKKTASTGSVDDLAKMLSSLGREDDEGKRVEDSSTAIDNAKQDLGAKLTDLALILNDIHIAILGGGAPTRDLSPEQKAAAATPIKTAVPSGRGPFYSWK